jgi:hypothetical protein
MSARASTPASPHRLLGAHVLGSANTYTGGGQASFVGAARGERDAEVGDQGVPSPGGWANGAIPRQQDVRRFDVAVYDAVPMGVVQCVGHFCGDADGVGHGKQPLAIETVAQRLA